MVRETRIQKVMADTGMAYMQAYRHVQQQDTIRMRLRANPRAFDMRFIQSEGR